MRMLSREYGALESQQPIAIGVVKPKKRLPFESMAMADDCVPRLPISTNDLGTLSALASHKVELSNMLSRTAFSVMPANEWKYKVRPLPAEPENRTRNIWMIDGPSEISGILNVCK